MSRWRVPAAVLVTTILIAGCSHGSSTTSARPAGDTKTTDRSAGATSSSSSSSTTSTDAPTTTTASTVPVEGDTLVAGVQGPRTKALQERLAALRFDVGTADGRFGAKTTWAIWAFQHLHGHAADGRVSPALYDEIMQASPPSPRQPAAGTHVEIDVAQQVLVLYQGNVARLVTHVSTGSGKHYCQNGHCGVADTPSGAYRFTWRVSGWHTSYLGKLYNPIFFNGGIAVHGATSVPNYPASHGCVRIPMHIAEYFPTLVSRGDPVYVFNGTGTFVPPAPETTTTTAPPTTSTTAAPTTSSTTTTAPPTTTTSTPTPTTTPTTTATTQPPVP